MLNMSEGGYQQLLSIKNKVDNIGAALDEVSQWTLDLKETHENLKALADQFHALLELLVKEDH
jgi:hypothetical protein